MTSIHPIQIIKNRNIKIHFYLLIAFALSLTGCRKEIQLNLPVYEPKMVLEFYLENNKSLSCLLQESINYTDTAKFKLIDNALVVLSYNGIKDTLVNTLYFDPYFQKIYNYHNPKIIQLQPNIEYEVYVKDNKGREMTGKTRLNNLVPIDSLVYKYNANNKAAAGLIFNDNGGTKNYYRIVAFKDGPTVDEEGVWDITFNDNLFNGDQFSFYTGYAFNPGDTVIGRLYHLTDEHNSFTESVNNAQAANGNPFGQPANIISNLTGGIGVFTTLIYAEKKVIIL
ncbi:MAG: DUF4249 family protein [Bacteroidota bacterium]|jgi:hypothetical protein